MVGFYDYTVILTYISLFSSIVGISFALNDKIVPAVFCLMFSGLCDMFDGKVASTKKNRTIDEKNFGIQIDSLCDVICFGVFPALIGYQLGLNKVPGIICLCLYVVAGVIRLAFFNVCAEKLSVEDKKALFTHGLPITSAAFIFPALMLVDKFIPFGTYKPLVFGIVMCLTALLFVLDIRIPKPQKRGKFIMIIAGIILFVVYSNFAKK